MTTTKLLCKLLVITLAGDAEYENAKTQLRKELMSILATTSMPKGFMPGKAVDSDTMQPVS